ncbi:GTPase family protein [Actinotalea solisilvae]|uniref:GTPase family protein n=1 Tax=Actinotalea solisilvae TaxID=2072922 RepID=UPI0018F13227|nr:GTPase [Actinotalea solisilvae]
MTQPDTTPAPAGTAPGSRTAGLLARVDRLERALDVAGPRVPDATASAVRGALATVRERLALGADHTVVALVGGTGSGKSSLFNALTGLPLADVGVSRPTTSQVTACVWAHDASALLDWLGVARDRRMERESELDGESQADLRGLILLDLPDHDSVEPAHREVVDRLLPLADLLVWVVDPQKYADDALHSGYLRHLTGHEGAMLVVVNQMDTVPVHAQAGLLRDVSRLLEEDGLRGVGVHSASARTGDGVPVVRGVLASTVAGHTVAQVRASAEIDDAARGLARVLGAAEVAPDALPRADAVTTLATAAGLEPALRLVEEGVAAGRTARGFTEPVQRDRVADLRGRWLDAAAAGLPAPWRSAVDAALPDHRALSAAVDDALGGVVLEGRRAGAATALRVLAAVLGVGGLVAAGLAVAAVAGGSSGGGVRALLAVVALALAVLLELLGRRVRRAAGRRGAARARDAALAALGTVVDERLVAPAAAVLAEHRAVREAAAVGPAVGSSSPGDGGATSSPGPAVPAP